MSQMLKLIISNVVLKFIFCQTVKYDYSCQLSEVVGTYCHSNKIYGLTQSDDGKQTISYSEDGTMIMWNLETNNALFQFKANKEGILLSFFQDNKLISLSTKGNLTHIDKENGQIIQQKIYDSIAFSSTPSKQDSINQLVGFDKANAQSSYQLEPSKRIYIFNQSTQIYSINYLKLSDPAIFKVNKNFTVIINTYELKINTRNITVVVNTYGFILVEYKLKSTDFSQYQNTKKVISSLVLENYLFLLYSGNAVIDIFDILKISENPKKLSIVCKQSTSISKIGYLQSIRTIYVINTSQIFFLTINVQDIQKNEIIAPECNLRASILSINTLIAYLYQNTLILVSSIDTITFVNIKTYEIKYQPLNKYQAVSMLQVIQNKLIVTYSSYFYGQVIISLQDYAILNILKCNQFEPPNQSTDSKISYDPETENLIISNKQTIELYDSFTDTSILLKQYYNASFYKVFPMFKYNIVFAFQSKFLVIFDYWDFESILQIDFFLLSDYYDAQMIDFNGIAIFYSFTSCLTQCVLVIKLDDLSYFYLPSLGEISTMGFISTDNLFYSMNYSTCLLSFFSLDISAKTITTKLKYTPGGCDSLYGYFIKSLNNILIFYNYYTDLHRYRILTYPSLTILLSFYDWNISPCDLTQIYYEQYQLISSKCQNKLYIYNLQGKVVYLFSAYLYFDKIQNIDNYLYVAEGGKLSLFNLSTQKVENLISIKSNLLYMIKQDKTNILFIGYATGDILYTDLQLISQKYFKISNELYSFFLHPFLPKIYCIQLTNALQQNDMNAGIYAQITKEGEFIFDKSGSSIIAMHFSIKLKQIIVVSELSAYFIDIRTNKIIYTFDKCKFDGPNISDSFFDEKTNILVLITYRMFCTISLDSMEILQNKLMKSICSKVNYKDDIFSKNIEGTLQFVGSDDSNYKYLVIFNIYDLSLVFCEKFESDQYYMSMNINQENQNQYLLTSSGDTKYLTITDNKLNLKKKTILPFNFSYYSFYFLCKQYALISNLRGFAVFISLETNEIILQKQYFYTSIATASYNYETKLLLISSETQSFQLSKLEIETGEEIVYYQKQICWANNQIVIYELDVFILTCQSIPELDNSFVKIMKLSTGEQVSSIKAEKFIHDSLFLFPFDILLYKFQNDFQEDREILISQATLLNLSSFYNPTQTHENKSKQIYFVNLIWEQNIDIYFVATREGNIYQYYPLKSKFQLIQVIKSQIFSFERVESDNSKQLILIQISNKILLFNTKTKQIIQELNYRNNQFSQSKNYILIIKKPFSIKILSQTFQLVKEIVLSHKINQIQIVQLEKEYALVTSLDGFVILINIQDGSILWNKQTEQFRIQGFCIDKQLSILITFSREQKLNIFTINNQKDDIQLQISTQQAQPIKKIFIIQNKIIVTYLSFRYIDIYEFKIENLQLTMKFHDFLILPFNIQNYIVDIINQNTQLIVYSDYQYSLYSLVSNQMVFKSSKSYISNKIVEIISISSTVFLICSQYNIEVVEINTDTMIFRKDYSILKSLSLFSSSSFKLFNMIKKYNSNNQIESLILVGSEIQSIKRYQVYLIDSGSNHNTDKGCKISLKSVSYYDLENKFKSLEDLNINQFNAYHITLIVEQDNVNSLNLIPSYLFQNLTTIILDGSSNNNQLKLNLNQILIKSLDFYKLEIIQFNITLVHEIQFVSSYRKEIQIKNCSLSLAYDTKGLSSELIGFGGLMRVQIIDFNLSNLTLPFSTIMCFRNVSQINLTNIYLVNNILQSSDAFSFDTSDFITIQNILIENNILSAINLGSKIFKFNQIQSMFIDGLKIQSNKGDNYIDVNKISTLFFLVNCQSVIYSNTQYIQNQNLILFSVSSKSIKDMLGFQEIIIYKLINIYIIKLIFFENINNVFPLIQIDSAMYVYITQSQFTQNQCLSNILCIKTVQQFKMDTITFKKNIGISGIQLINNLLIDIQNGRFEQNTSLQNGGVFQIVSDDIISDQENNNIIKQCYFIKNTAFYSGGAIYLENTKINIVQSYFQENNASIGGAIRYTGLQPSFIKQKSSNKYQKNNAFLFGQNIGSYPLYAVVDSRRKLDELEITGYRSGDTVDSFIIYILDEEKNIINTKYQEQLKTINTNIQNESSLNKNKIEELFRATTQFINDEIEQFVITANSPDDKLLSVSNITIFYYDTLNYYFDLRGLVIYGIPEQSATILFQIPFLKQFNNESVVKDNSNHTVTISFRKCIRGELYQKRTDTLYSCDRCLDNRYSLVEPNITDTSQVCKQCSSDYSQSCELDKIQLKKGYWRESLITDEIIFCENNPSNCEGTESTYYCSQGYVGPLCEECDNYRQVWGKAYARSNSFQCNDCNDSSVIYSKIVFVTVAVSIYFYITVKKQLEKSCKRAICTILRQSNLLVINMSCQRNEEINSIQKLIIHFLQVTSVLNMYKSINFDFNQLSSIFGQPQTVVSSSFDCILSQQNQIPIHYMRTFYGLFLPIQYIIVSIVLQSIFMLLFNFQLKKQFIITSINFGILFFQTGIVKNLIDIIFCRKIGSKFYIKSQINYECYTHQHLDYIYTYFIPLGVILVFILPLLVLYVLRQNKEKLKYSASAIIKYGLFFLDYKEKTYYWEFIKILLRLMIILVMNFLDQYNQVKYDFCAVMLIIYTLSILKYQPYFLAQLNSYDIIQTSLTAILFMLESISLTEKINVQNIAQKLFIVVQVGVLGFFLYIIIKTFIISKAQFLLKRFVILQTIFKTKPIPNSMRKFFLWRKLRKNIAQVSQSLAQNNIVSKMQKSILLNTQMDTSSQGFKSYYGDSPVSKKQKRFEKSQYKFKI